MAVDVLMNSRRYDSPVWSLITLDSHSSSDRDQIVPPLESNSVRLCVCTSPSHGCSEGTPYVGHYFIQSYVLNEEGLVVLVGV